MPNLDLTRHAAVRANQRGVPHHLLRALIDHADIDAPADNGCRLLRFSKERLKDRALRAEIGVETDRLATLAVIWSDSDSRVVTVLHHRAGRLGRRYRAVH